MTYQITSTSATFWAVTFNFKFLFPYFQNDIAVSCMEGTLVSFSTKSSNFYDYWSSRNSHISWTKTSTV